MKVSIRFWLWLVFLILLSANLVACTLTDEVSGDEGDVIDRDCVVNEENIQLHIQPTYAENRMGSSIDFVWMLDSNSLVFRVDPGILYLLTLTDETREGYEFRRLLEGEFDNVVTFLASPTERAIAFSVVEDTNKRGIYRFNIDSEELTRLNQPGSGDMLFNWLPTGKYVTVVRGSLETPDYYNLSVDGRQHEVSVFHGSLGQFSWHSNGQDIIYADHNDGNIYEVDTERGTKTQVTTSKFCKYDPTWSPDGNSIAFISSDDGRPNLYVAKADGAEARSLIQFEGKVEQYDWSPDSQKIALSFLTIESYEKHNAEIYVLDFDGSNLRQLTQSEGENESSPQWSPDGKRLAFLSYVESEETVYLNILSLADGRKLRLAFQ